MRCPAEVEVDEECYDPAYLDAVEGEEAYLDSISPENGKPSWKATIMVDGQEVCFKLDTGAEVSVITEKTMQSLKREGNVAQKATRRLVGADK